MNIVITIISIIFEYFTIIRLIGTFFTRKDNFNNIKGILLSVIFMILSILFPYFSICFSFVYIIFIVNGYRIQSLKLNLIYSIMIFLFLSILEVIISQACSVIYGSSVQEIVSNSISYTFVVIFAKALSYLIVTAINIIYKEKKYLYATNTSWITLLISLCILISFCIFGKILFLAESKAINFLGSVVLVLLVLLLLFYLEVNDMQNNMTFSQYELNSLKQFIEFSEKYNDKVVESINEIREIKHNLNNQLIGISNMIESGNIVDSLAYIKSITHQLDISLKERVFIGDPFIDGIINNKILFAESNSIETTVYSDIINIGSIDNMDLGLLIGCAFDNALEANLKNKNLKGIEMFFSTKGQYFVFKIINPVDYTDTINVNITSKEFDKKSHGYGLKTIEKIAKKYQGTYNIFLKENTFSLCVMLNIWKDKIED